jgi:hypothetical protein
MDGGVEEQAERQLMKWETRLTQHMEVCRRPMVPRERLLCPAPSSAPVPQGTLLPTWNTIQL